jgi:hypothetical protein
MADKPPAAPATIKDTGKPRLQLDLHQPARHQVRQRRRAMPKTARNQPDTIIRRGANSIRKASRIYSYI